MNSKISIITVSFNASRTIEATIKSVISQSYKNTEYIIVDGKSNDSTLKIVNKYKKNISKIISESDKGLYDAMNKGVKCAKGDIIYFLNADDVLVDDKVIEKVVKSFDKNTDFVYGDVLFFYPVENKKVKISRNASINDLRNSLMPPHQATFVRKEVLEKYPFDLSYRSSADFDFFCRLISSGAKGKKINEVIAQNSIGGISSSSISYKETELIIKKYFGSFWYYKIVIKHKLFNILKKIFGLLKISYHIG